MPNLIPQDKQKQRNCLDEYSLGEQSFHEEGLFSIFLFYSQLAIFALIQINEKSYWNHGF